MTNPTTTDRELVTSAELAAHLGVTRRTLKRYKAKGLVKPVRRHQFKHLWDLEEAVADLKAHGMFENLP